MVVAVVDGMGGGIGAQLVERIQAAGWPGVTVWALGTNALATRRMVDAGAHRGASGENAIRVSVASVDCIVGPIGIVLANALMGEVTPAIAEAVLMAPGTKLILPVAQGHVVLVGQKPRPLAELIDETIEALGRLL